MKGCIKEARRTYFAHTSPSHFWPHNLLSENGGPVLQVIYQQSLQLIVPKYYLWSLLPFLSAFTLCSLHTACIIYCSKTTAQNSINSKDIQQFLTQHQQQTIMTVSVCLSLPISISSWHHQEITIIITNGHQRRMSGVEISYQSAILVSLWKQVFVSLISRLSFLHVSSEPPSSQGGRGWSGRLLLASTAPASSCKSRGRHHPEVIWSSSPWPFTPPTFSLNWDRLTPRLVTISDQYILWKWQVCWPGPPPCDTWER